MGHLEPEMVEMNASTEILAYRIPDAVRVSGIGRTKIFELIKTGDLRAVRVGGRTLVPASELRRLLGEAG